MPKGTDLGDKARTFAAIIQRILNVSVCDQVKMRAITRDDRTYGVAPGLSKDNVEPRMLPLRKSPQNTRAYLQVTYDLVLDATGTYLTVETSFFGIYADAEAQKTLCHFDYERDKKDGYPESHVQVAGESEALAILRPGRPLSKLHFPVGGRRFRPCLEDVIDFLVVEELTTAKSGYQDELEREREQFRKIQLRAAIAKYPEIAREMLRTIDERAQAGQ